MRFILPALTTIAFGLVAALPSNSPPVKESLHEERRLTPPKLYHNPNTKHSNLPTASLTVNTSHRADDEAFNFEMHDSDEEQKPDGELPCTTLSQQNSVIELKSFADYSHPWAIPGNNDLHVAVLKAENDRVDVLKKEIARLLNKEKDAHANQPESHSEILLLVKEKYFAAQNELDLTPLSLAIVR